MKIINKGESKMKVLFNGNWQFRLGESEWQNVEIPHDWLIYNTARLYEDGVGEYRKTFNVTDLSLVHTIIFDGVYMNSEVFVNGRLAGEWKYGYTAFSFDISRFLQEGANEILVRVNHQAPNTRWYSGAGIFRNVWLNAQNPTRIVNDGVYISTKKLGDTWELRAETELIGEAEVRHTLLDAAGGAIATFEDSATLSHVNLWDIKNPYVYKLKTELIVNNEAVDTEINPVGFRTVEFNPAKGFFLNNNYMKMHGVCLHHDLGAFGAAFNVNAARRQIEIMQEMGVNAIRFAHNPPAREYLDLCDEMGILAIDELLDMWELPKNKNDYARFFPEWHARDVASWIRRDRNHPCVIMWSIGNEIYDTHKDERGLEVAKALLDLTLEHDPCKNAKATIGSNFMPYPNAQKVADELKLAGYNYAEGLYDEHHEKYPDWFIYGAETASTVRSRGIFRFPVDMPVLSFEDLQCSDLGNSVVGWGKSAEQAWIDDRDKDYCGGQFIWTGIDYIGEPTPYSTKNSYFGAVDTAGFPKAAFWFYRAVWHKTTEPFIKLFPHWDWNDGQLIDVIAYSNVEEAELFLNGKSLGVQTIDLKNGKNLRYTWRVPFEKGTLEIKAYKNNTEVASDCKKSFGEAVSIKTKSKTYGDLTFTKIYAVDKDGIPVENARNRIKVSGDLLGLDSGDSTDWNSYKGDNKRLFSGQLLAISRGDIGAKFSGEEVPLRKIALSAENLTFTKDNKQIRISAKLFPENASYTDLKWRCVLDTGTSADIAKIIESDNASALVESVSDGVFKLRATCTNGKENPEIISELNMKIEGVADATKYPFVFIHAGRYDISYAPLKIIEHGAVSGVNDVKTLAGFKNVNFAGHKTRSLRLFIGTTSYYDEVPVELHIGDVKAGTARLLQTLSFPRNNLHYDFAPYDFELSEDLTGKHDICFVLDRRCVFGGFEFINKRIFEPVYASENDEIYGDNYVINDRKIENIGNNVILKFNELDFGTSGVNNLIISGFAPKGNSISMKFGEQTHMIEFAKCNEYQTQNFWVANPKGICDLSFVFLPGSDFNFEWFKFENKDS
jgi:beta-galactosidase